MKKFGFVVFVVVLNLFVSSSSFSSATEDLEGTLEIIMTTEVGKKTCEPLHFINVSGKKTQFSLPARAPLLSPGQKIKISGRWEESNGEKRFHCRKVEAIAVAPKAKRAISSADSASDYLPKQDIVLGPQKVLIVCLNFTDTENDSPVWTEEKIDDKIFTNKHSLDAYWKECSVNKVSLTGDILDKGNWKTMPKNWVEYGYDSSEERKLTSEFVDDMIALIDPEVNLSKYDGLIVFRAGKKWNYDWSTVGKSMVLTDEGEVKISMSFLMEYDIEIENDYAAHESGHGFFFLSHAYSVSTISGKIYPYGDWWDNRGKRCAILDGLHKYKLGWLNINQIKIIDSSGEYWVDQRELTSSGIKLLAIPLEIPGIYNYEFRYSVLIYIEYHRGLGEFDSQLPFFINSKNETVDQNNLVLYKKYERKPDYDSLVYMASDGNDCLDLESQEFCDSDYENLESFGVCIQVLEKTETEDKSKSQAKVKITLTSDYSFPTPIPTPTPTPCKPAIVSISSGGSMNIKKKTSGKVTVEVTSANGCAVEGEMVEAIVTSASGQKRIAVSPPEGETDENGQVVFTITAQKKFGNAVVAFWAGNLKTFLYVKVSKK